MGSLKFCIMINTQSLKRAIVISEKLESLQAELNALLGSGFSSSTSSQGAKSRRGGRRKLSAEAREKIAAAQRRRWAKAKGGKAEPKPEKPAKKKRKMSAEGLARIKAAQKARWDKVRAAKAGKKA